VTPAAESGVAETAAKAAAEVATAETATAEATAVTAATAVGLGRRFGVELARLPRTRPIICGDGQRCVCAGNVGVRERGRLRRRGAELRIQLARTQRQPGEQEHRQA
jgi:hypothetical protein